MAKLNIVVLIRNVVDCRIPLPVDGYCEKPLAEGIVKIINPADWMALEQALNLAKPGNKVTALCLGDKDSEESLRWCLAAGAHSALRIWDPALAEADQLGRGKVIAGALLSLKPQLVLCGDTCLDQLDSLYPGVAAASARMTFVPSVAKIEHLKEGRVVVVRRLEKGKRERVFVSLPALVAFADEGEATGLYPELPSLVRAMQEIIPCRDLSDLGLSLSQTGSYAAKVYPVMIRQAKPLVTRPVTPDHRFPAEQRLRTILTGGVVRKQGETIKGSTEEMVDKILAFLQHESVVRL